MAKTTKPSQATIIRVGQDEMNLAVLPIGSLQKEVVKGKVVETTWTIPHPTIPGKTVEAMWRRAGDPEHGLPTAADIKIYLVMMEMTREAGWPQTVPFSAWQMLKRAGISDSHRNYEALKRSLLRLRSVNYTANYCFWDNVNKRVFGTKSFSLIDDLSLDYMNNVGRRKEGSLPLCSWKWSDVVYESMRAEYVKPLDLDFALSLKLPLALALYRYLDKKRYSKSGPRSGWGEGLRHLCEKHLGMDAAATQHNSTMKRTLEKAHNELVARGFLHSVHYSNLKSREGIKVTYIFGSQLNSVEKQKATPAPAPSPEQRKADSRNEACDRALEKIKADDSEDYARIYQAARENLGPLDIDMLNRDPDHTGVARTIRNHMRDIVEMEYADIVDKG